MKLKRLLALSVLALSLQSYAEATADSVPVIVEITEPGIITVELPKGLETRLTPVGASETPAEAPAAPTKNTQRSGYRVQVFDDNNPRTAKQTAQTRRRQIEANFPEYRVYVQFRSPYWRVKVGDFKTSGEAEAAMAAIRARIPSMGPQLRIVRDRINAR